jgi:hypothetical protein
MFDGLKTSLQPNQQLSEYAELSDEAAVVTHGCR